MTDAAITIVPANEARWLDLQTIFGTRGIAATCQCQRYKLAPRESFASFPVEQRTERLRAEAGCDDPGARRTSGLTGWLEDEPVGWCAVQPRAEYPALLRTGRVPWVGRSEDRTDTTVWAVTCFVVRVGYRRRGVARALAQAAVDHARGQGAASVEAYPTATVGTLPEELHVGTVSMFAEAGMTEVASPTLRRSVMRLDF